MSLQHPSTTLWLESGLCHDDVLGKTLPACLAPPSTTFGRNASNLSACPAAPNTTNTSLCHDFVMTSLQHPEQIFFRKRLRERDRVFKSVCVKIHVVGSSLLTHRNCLITPPPPPPPPQSKRSAPLLLAKRSFAYKKETERRKGGAREKVFQILLRQTARQKEKEQGWGVGGVTDTEIGIEIKEKESG